MSDFNGLCEKWYSVKRIYYRNKHRYTITFGECIPCWILRYAYMPSTRHIYIHIVCERKRIKEFEFYAKTERACKPLHFIALNCIYYGFVFLCCQSCNKKKQHRHSYKCFHLASIKQQLKISFY
ncbi:hypothetical protein DSECCO2_653860 [anaerobic digester metagenome]